MLKFIFTFLLFEALCFGINAKADSSYKISENAVGDYTTVYRSSGHDCDIDLKIEHTASGSRIGELFLCDQPVAKIDEQLVQLFKLHKEITSLRCTWSREIGLQYVSSFLVDANWDVKTGKLATRESVNSYATKVYRSVAAVKSVETDLEQAGLKIKKVGDANVGQPKRKTNIEYPWLKEVQGNPFLLREPRCFYRF